MSFFCCIISIALLYFFSVKVVFSVFKSSFFKSSFLESFLLSLYVIAIGLIPVYFNCRPNFALSLSGRNIMDALTLNVKTDGYYMKEVSEPLAIIYKIYYKLMKTTLDPQSMVEPSPKGHTILLQASTPNNRLRVP